MYRVPESPELAVALREFRRCLTEASDAMRIVGGWREAAPLVRQASAILDTLPEMSGDPNGPRCLSDPRVGRDTGASHE
jgi:hypothetical protein